MAGRFTVETTFRGVDQTSSVISGIEKRVNAMQRSVSGASKFVDKGFGALKQVGAAIAYTGVAAAGAGIAFAQAISPGADFDQAMSAVGAVSLMTRDQVADLEAEARKLGKTTKYSATEVAGGMELMGKAGFTNSQIMAGIGPMLSAAAAEGAGFEETASVISNTIKGMGMSLNDTARVADVLTLASAKTNSSISSLGESMAIVAPTARQLGVPFEDAAAAVAKLQDQGLDASVAGSAVATMLTNLSKPPKDIAAKMKAMGVSFQDAHGDMLPFRDVIGQLAKAGKNAGGNMAQVAFFADLVGMRGQKAALNLKDIGPALADLTKELAGAKGKAQEMAALKMDNFKGDMIKLSNLATDVGIDFFDLVKGPPRSAAEATRGWLASNEGLIKKDVAGWVEGISASVGNFRNRIDEGVAVVGLFKDGLENAFKHSASIAVFGTVLDKVFGGKDDEGPGKKAYDLGYGIGYAVDKFVLFTGAVKVAEAGLWIFGNTAKLMKAGIWLWNAALATAEFITGALGVTQVGTTGLTVAFGGAMTTSSIAAYELALAEEAATAAGGELALAEGAAATSAGTMAAATTSVTSALGAMAAKAGIAALAAGAVYAAYDQAQAFMAENGGWDGVNAFLGLGTENGDYGFTAVDAMMNRKAKEQALADGRIGPNATGTPAAQMRVSEILGGPDAAPKTYAEQFGLPPLGPRPPGPYADGYVTPSVTPQVAPSRDAGGGDQARINQQLQDTIKQLVPQLAGALKGTITIQLPKGATGDVSGAPGVVVSQSGGF
ncbi:MAG: phage tail tape measure protein [Myxococcales bacterium]